MAGSPRGRVPPNMSTLSMAPLGVCSMLFKVYFADDRVIDPDSLLDTRLYASFGLAPVVRFHAYAPGNSYGVYELLTVFAMPPTAVSIGDLISAGVGSWRQPEEHALLATPFDASNHVGLRVYRFHRSTGRRDNTRLLGEEPVDDPQYDCRFIVEFLADSCWRLKRQMPRGFANCNGLACTW